VEREAQREPGFTSQLFTFWQCKQIVRLLAIILRLDVFVAIMSGNVHVHCCSAARDEELFATFYFDDTCRLCDFECRTRRANPAYILDAFVRIVSVRFVDALNLMSSHGVSFPLKSGLKDQGSAGRFRLKSLLSQCQSGSD
jgi:hypothetical protein